MIRAVTVTAAVLGNLLGITQIDYWCERLSDVLEDYWMRIRSVPTEERPD